MRYAGRVDHTLHLTLQTSALAYDPGAHIAAAQNEPYCLLLLAKTYLRPHIMPGHDDIAQQPSHVDIRDGQSTEQDTERHRDIGLHRSTAVASHELSSAPSDHSQAWRDIARLAVPQTLAMSGWVAFPLVAWGTGLSEAGSTYVVVSGNMITSVAASILDADWSGVGTKSKLVRVFSPILSTTVGFCTLSLMQSFGKYPDTLVGLGETALIMAAAYAWDASNERKRRQTSANNDIPLHPLTSVVVEPSRESETASSPDAPAPNSSFATADTAAVPNTDAANTVGLVRSSRGDNRSGEGEEEEIDPGAPAVEARRFV